MINLTCPCGFRFALPDELAGGGVQCPKCRRLNDVPELEELPNLDADGAIKLRPAEEPKRTSVFAEQIRLFDPNRRSADGEEYDLRPTLDDVARAGVEEIPLELKDEARPGPPKYDPETGELIRPLGVAPPPPAPPAVIPAPPRVEEPPLDNRFAPVVLRILRGPNLVVLLVVYAIHVVCLAMLGISASGLFLGGLIAIVLLLLLLAHYGNVVDEIAVEERDELPAPLRQIGWAEDIRHPIASLMGAALLCYGPAVLARTIPPAAVALAVLGTAFFPAVFLTLSTGSSVLNLRPDRVLAVMRRCGAAYVVSIIMWCAAAAAYYAAWLGTSHLAVFLSAGTQHGAGRHSDLSSWAGFAMLFVAICLMHLFCWHLGLLYRRHHESFPWVLQRHDWAALNQPVPRRRRRRRPAATPRHPSAGPAAAPPRSP